MIPLSALRQKQKIIVPAHASRSEVVLNDEHRNLAIGGNHHRAPRAFADIHAMAPLLPCETKPGAKKHALQRPSIDRRELRYGVLDRQRRFSVFHRNPLRRLPTVSLSPAISGFLQHLLERAD